jgi:hypothetical protein
LERNTRKQEMGENSTNKMEGKRPEKDPEPYRLIKLERI